MASKVSREKGYVGETRTQLRHGYGIYKYPNQFFRYEGEWKEGKKHGHGKLVMTDGSYYEGEFINGEIEGHGFRKWATTGNTYSGQFCNGELNGFGIMTYGTGAVYEGEFQSNKREGRGVMKFADGSVYEGLFHNNVRHGEGSQSFANGDCYVGDWVQDKRQGSGELKFYDGSVYDGQWRNDFYNGAGTLIHSSGMTYDGMWVNGRPAVEAAKIAIITDECQELAQDVPFTITIEIKSEEGELVVDEQGRELHISAGFKHQVPNQGSPLLDLIEDMEETPIPTPYYDVVSYPITEYSFMEERLKAMDESGLMKPPGTAYSDGTSLYPSAAPSVTEDAPESFAEIENNERETELPAPTSDVKEEDVEQEKVDPGKHVEIQPEISRNLEDEEYCGETGLDEKDDKEMSESPTPPPVSRRRTQSGKVQFEVRLVLTTTFDATTILSAKLYRRPLFYQVFLIRETLLSQIPLFPIPPYPPVPKVQRTKFEEGNQEAQKAGCKDIALPPPPPGYRPFSVLDITLEEEAKAKVRNSKTGALAQQLKIGAKMGKNIDELPFQPPEQVNFEKIKDPKIAKAKREKLYGDERFARPGEYIIIVSDVTNPPFLGKQLPPAFCRIKVLHPKKLKKVKTPTKSKSSSKAPE
ncbi:MORN repeat-containing protein 1 [Holothuria leucospilota]|uniref:MORN repeat-containing protein 1 n=1 Tax=Holothuria leucospilota TaxID=206669 RepID=A0A9Q0YIR3_HOLLE|nr:MORN repeat-containing protein 1 [Holothuria leucospilota]